MAKLAVFIWDPRIPPDATEDEIRYQMRMKGLIERRMIGRDESELDSVVQQVENKLKRYLRRKQGV